MPTDEADKWRLGLGGKPGASCRMIPRVNHLLVPGRGRSTPEEYERRGHVSLEVIREIAVWIGERFTRGSPRANREVDQDKE